MRQPFFTSIIAAGIILILASCSKSKPASQTDFKDAEATGRELALQLSADRRAASDSVMLTSILIDVRAREASLRDNGYGNVADTFIDSFLATLDSVNPALRAELQ